MSGDGGDKDFDTDEQKAAASFMQSRYNAYLQNYLPLENEFRDQVFAYRSPGQMQEAAGQAQAAFQGQFGEAVSQSEQEAFAAGIDPSSGTFIGESKALRRAQAAAMGGGVANAKITQNDRFFGGLQSLVAIGQGQSAEVSQGLGDVAAQSTADASAEANAAYTASSGRREGIGVGAGLAAGVAANTGGVG